MKYYGKYMTKMPSIVVLFLICLLGFKDALVLNMYFHTNKKEKSNYFCPIIEYLIESKIKRT